MAGKVSLDGRPWFDRTGYFYFSAWIVEGDLKEGDWIRLPGWKTEFVRYPIHAALPLHVMDLFKPTDNLRGIQVTGVSQVQGHWLAQRMPTGTILEVVEPDHAFRAPAEEDAPRLRPAWLRRLFDHDV
jgi:hypothetical protein